MFRHRTGSSRRDENFYLDAGCAELDRKKLAVVDPYSTYIRLTRGMNKKITAKYRRLPLQKLLLLLLEVGFVC